MKFDFSAIQNPTLAEGNSNRIEGTLPNGVSISVERHLSHWEPHLKIVIDGAIFHDYDVQPEEKAEYEKLRNRTFEEKSNKADAKREKIGKLAKMYLTPSPKAPKA